MKIIGTFLKLFFPSENTFIWCQTLPEYPGIKPIFTSFEHARFFLFFSAGNSLPFDSK